MDKGLKDLIEELREYAAPRKGHLAGMLLEAANRLEELAGGAGQDDQETKASNMVHVSYHVCKDKEHGFGAAEVQLPDDCRICDVEVLNSIRDRLLEEFPEGSSVVILSWQRYEGV